MVVLLLLRCAATTLERSPGTFAALAMAGYSPHAGGGEAVAGICDLASQKTRLRSYMLDWCSLERLSPNPDPAGYASVSDYSRRSATRAIPASASSPWSYIQDSVSCNRFFAEGRAMGLRSVGERSRKWVCC